MRKFETGRICNWLLVNNLARLAQPGPVVLLARLARLDSALKNLVGVLLEEVMLKSAKNVSSLAKTVLEVAKTVSEVAKNSLEVAKNQTCFRGGQKLLGR